MSTPSPRYHKGNLAETLLDAAMTMLQSQPAATLSLREVAKVAGVSHNAPYHHFTDRSALLHAVAVRAMSDLLHAQTQAAEHESDPGARLVAVGSAYVDYAMQHPHAFAVIFDPAVCEPGNPLPDMAPLISANERLLAEVVSAAHSANVLASDDEQAAATALWSTAHGLASLVAMGQLPSEAITGSLSALLR